MKFRLPCRLACAAVLPLLQLASPLHAQSGIVGTWTGVWTRDGSDLSVEFRFARQDTAYTGSFSSDQLRVSGIPIATISQKGRDVSWTIPGDRTTASFAGQIRGDSMVGSFKDGAATGTFRFVRRSRAVSALREENVSFRNGDVQLSGTLVLPPQSGRHPAIVFVHGSGAEGRWANRYLATRFAERGVAALVFDKRGVGQSTGDWRSAGFEDLAGDVAAGVEYLRTRADIDPAEVGIHGHSQGGTYAPLIATRASVAFVIGSAAAGVSPADAEVYSLENSMRITRLDSAEATAARLYAREVVDVAYNGKNRTRLDSLAIAYRGRAWVFELPPPSASYWAFSRRIASYDPLATWRQVRVPVLLMYGERDERVPPRLSAARIASELLTSGNSSVTVRIFPEADHTFRVQGSGSGFAWPRTAPGYLDALLSWIETVVRLPGAGPARKS